ncbi:MAG: hypothetical protein NVSMB46_05900 [Candidatus Saccharimonadales bacterium]
MEKVPYLQFDNSLATIQTKMLELKDEVERRRVFPPAGDVYIAAFSEAVQFELEANEKLKETLVFSFGSRENLDAPHTYNLLLRSIVKQVLRKQEELHFPYKFYKPDSWREAIEEIVDEPEELTMDLMIRNVTSNKEERYKTLKLINLLYQDRFGTYPKIIDFGASQNHGLKMIAGNFPIEYTDVVDAKDNRNNGFVEYGKTEEVNIEMTNKLNDLMQESTGVSDSLGVDILWKDDKITQEWARSCSFYPSEIAQKPQLIKQYNDLDNYESDNVNFIMSDICDPQLSNSLEIQSRKADIIFISTIMNQLNSTQRRNALINAVHCVQDEGLIVVQDFVMRDSRYPSEQRFLKDWHSKKYTYRTMIYDVKDDTRSFHEIMHWDNGRCRRLKVPLGSTALRKLLHY